MKARLWWRAGLLGLAFGLGGCDVASLVYFLSPETKAPAECRSLVDEDPKKEVRIVIWPTVSNASILRLEFLQADRQLGELVARQLGDLYKENQEKVVVVPPRKVEEYKSTHAGWRNDFDPVQLGRHFAADYVIVVDIHALSLYEEGSSNTVYRGKAQLTLTLVDADHPDESPERRELSYNYPSDARPVLADADTPPLQFRTQFLGYIAKRLAWQFAAHPQQEIHDVIE
jgi:hypothetical protein